MGNERSGNERFVPISNSWHQFYAYAKKDLEKQFEEIKQIVLGEERIEIGGKEPGEKRIADELRFPLLFKYFVRDDAYYLHTFDPPWLKDKLSDFDLEEFIQKIAGTRKLAGEVEGPPQHKAMIYSLTPAGKGENGECKHLHEIRIDAWDEIISYFDPRYNKQQRIHPLTKSAQEYQELNRRIIERIKTKTGQKLDLLESAIENYFEFNENEKHKAAQITTLLRHTPFLLTYCDSQGVLKPGPSSFTLLTALKAGLYHWNFGNFIGGQARGEHYYRIIKELNAFFDWDKKRSAVFIYPLFYKGERLLGAAYSWINHYRDIGENEATTLLDCRQVEKVFEVLRLYGHILSKEIFSYHQNRFVKDVLKEIIQDGRQSREAIISKMFYLTNSDSREIILHSPELPDEGDVEIDIKKYQDRLKNGKIAIDHNNGTQYVPVDYTYNSTRQLRAIIELPRKIRILGDQVYEEDPAVVVEAIRSVLASEEVLRLRKEQAGAVILLESYAHNIGAHGMEGLKNQIKRLWEDLQLPESPSPDGTSTDHLSQQSAFQRRVQLAALLEGKHFDRLSALNGNLVNMIRNHQQFAEFISYMQGKSAFWNAISRGGKLLGGEHDNLWNLISTFARNNLLCAAIGASESFEGIEFTIHFASKNVKIGVSDWNDCKLYFGLDEEGTEEKHFQSSYQKRIKQNVDDRWFESFDKIKNKLEDKLVFLPEGIVAQHAIYTLWENLIRNVKHCDNPGGAKHIPFHIRIEEHLRQFMVTVWIDLPSHRKSDETKETFLHRLTERVNDMCNWAGLLKDDNQVNMGGTSQNILCAGMALGLDFISTERRQKLSSDNLHKIINFTLDGERIKVRFKLWRGEKKVVWDREPYEDFDKKVIDQIGRYRIVILNRAEDAAEVNKAHGPLRTVVADPVESYETLYRRWTEGFVDDSGPVHVAYPENLEIKIRTIPEPTSPTEGKRQYGRVYLFYHRNSVQMLENFQNYCHDKIEKLVQIPFKHGHVFSKYSDLTNNFSSLYDLVEILGARIDIIDNRLFKGYQKLTEIKNQQGLLNDLSVQVLNEEAELPAFNGMRKHFLILHLSWLEAKTARNDAEAIRVFLDNNRPRLEKCYRYVLITTGRGRNWWEGIPAEYQGPNLCLRYISIENLEWAFDHAVHIEPKSPAFGLKYSLVKTLLGS